MLSHHLHYQFFMIANSVLRRLNLDETETSFLRLHSFQLVSFSNTLYVFVRLRFFTGELWNLVPERDFLLRYTKAKYFRRRKPKLLFKWIQRKRKKFSFRRRIRKRPKVARRRRWNRPKPGAFPMRWRFIKKRVYSLNDFKNKLLFNYPDPFVTKRKYTRSIRKAWNYFFLLPYLLYFKKFFVHALKTKMSSNGLIKVFFLGINQRGLNANIIINFMVSRLYHRQLRISRVLYDILKVLNKLVKIQTLHGYKLLMAGRFSRRDRATYIWKGFSSTPISPKLSTIDFEYRTLQMRYSLGIIKLWICQS